MNEWKQRRNWSRASIDSNESGHAIGLDDRIARTPGGRSLVLPTRRLAELVAAEFHRQGKFVDPDSMPFTRRSHAAIDRIADMSSEVVEELASYASCDLLCYRAREPEELRRRQLESWNPLLAWIREAIGADMETVDGVTFIRQPERSVEAIRKPIRDLGTFELAGFSEMVSLTGSAVLALAVRQGRLSETQAWNLSRLDEDWQRERWGADREADVASAEKMEAFLTACRFMNASR